MESLLIEKVGTVQAAVVQNLDADDLQSEATVIDVAADSSEPIHWIDCDSGEQSFVSSCKQSPVSLCSPSAASVSKTESEVMASYSLTAEPLALIERQPEVEFSVAVPQPLPSEWRTVADDQPVQTNIERKSSDQGLSGAIATADESIIDCSDAERPSQEAMTSPSAEINDLQYGEERQSIFDTGKKSAAAAVENGHTMRKSNNQKVAKKRSAVESSAGGCNQSVTATDDVTAGLDAAPADIDECNVIVSVTCGSNAGHLLLGLLRNGSRGRCVQFNGELMTPNQFQRVSGRWMAKDWKRSIKHCGRSLKQLLKDGTMSWSPPECRCTGCRDRHSQLANVDAVVSSSVPNEENEVDKKQQQTPSVKHLVKRTMEGMDLNDDDDLDEFNQFQSSLHVPSSLGQQLEPDDLSIRKTFNFGNQTKLDDKSPIKLRTVTSSSDSSVSGSEVNAVTSPNAGSKCAPSGNRYSDYVNNVVENSGSGICEQFPVSRDREDGALRHNGASSKSKVVAKKEQSSPVFYSSSECSSTETMNLETQRSLDELDNAIEGNSPVHQIAPSQCHNVTDGVTTGRNVAVDGATIETSATLLGCSTEDAANNRPPMPMMNPLEADNIAGIMCVASDSSSSARVLSPQPSAINQQQQQRRRQITDHVTNCSSGGAAPRTRVSHPKYGDRRETDGVSESSASVKNNKTSSNESRKRLAPASTSASSSQRFDVERFDGQASGGVERRAKSEKNQRYSPHPPPSLPPQQLLADSSSEMNSEYPMTSYWQNWMEGVINGRKIASDRSESSSYSGDSSATAAAAAAAALSNRMREMSEWAAAAYRSFLMQSAAAVTVAAAAMSSGTYDPSAAAVIPLPPTVHDAYNCPAAGAATTAQLFGLYPPTNAAAAAAAAAYYGLGGSSTSAAATGAIFPALCGSTGCIGPGSASVSAPLSFHQTDDSGGGGSSSTPAATAWLQGAAGELKTGDRASVDCRLRPGTGKEKRGGQDSTNAAAVAVRRTSREELMLQQPPQWQQQQQQPRCKRLRLDRRRNNEHRHQPQHQHQPQPSDAEGKTRGGGSDESDASDRNTTAGRRRSEKDGEGDGCQQKSNTSAPSKTGGGRHSAAGAKEGARIRSQSDDDSDQLERGPQTTSPSIVRPPTADGYWKTTCSSLPGEKRRPAAMMQASAAAAAAVGGGYHQEQQRQHHKTNDYHDDQKNDSPADGVDERGRTAGKPTSSSTTSPDGGYADDADWSVDGLNPRTSIARRLLDGNYQISLGGRNVYPTDQGLHWIYGGIAGEPGGTVATAMAQLMMLQDGGMSLLSCAAGAGYLGNRNSVGVPPSAEAAFRADDVETTSNGGSGSVIYDRYGAIDLSNRRSTSA